MDIFVVLIAGAAIAYIHNTLGSNFGYKIAPLNCVSPKIAGPKEITKRELTEEELSAAVIAYRARLARAQAARERVTISEEGE